MAQNKKHITPENITEWLSSTGFLFPRNEVELERFEKIYGEEDFGLSGNEIDPEKIINGTFREKKFLKMPVSIKEDNAMKLKHMYLEILEKEGDLDFNKWKLGIKEPVIKQTIFENEPAI